VSVSIKPLEDRIVIKQVEAEQTTSSGLVIPDTVRRRRVPGALGSRRAGGRRPLSRQLFDGARMLRHPGPVCFAPPIPVNPQHRGRAHTIHAWKPVGSATEVWVQQAGQGAARAAGRGRNLPRLGRRTLRLRDRRAPQGRRRALG